MAVALGGTGAASPPLFKGARGTANLPALIWRPCTVWALEQVKQDTLTGPVGLLFIKYAPTGQLLLSLGSGGIARHNRVTPNQNEALARGKEA